MNTGTETVFSKKDHDKKDVMLGIHIMFAMLIFYSLALACYFFVIQFSKVGYWYEYYTILPYYILTDTSTYLLRSHLLFSFISLRKIYIIHIAELFLQSYFFCYYFDFCHSTSYFATSAIYLLGQVSYFSSCIYSIVLVSSVCDFNTIVRDFIFFYTERPAFSANIVWLVSHNTIRLIILEWTR